MDPQLIDLRVGGAARNRIAKSRSTSSAAIARPQTNAMLRRRSRGVARFSQHMLGHAMDFYIPGVPLEELREIGLRLQRGGVGFYPTSGSPFVHMDTGGVRMWPRMTRDELLHVFPDGRTVYLPTDGHPLPGYAVALADLRKRGQNPTATWSEEARDEGLDENIVLASDTSRTTNRLAPIPVRDRGTGRRCTLNSGAGSAVAEPQRRARARRKPPRWSLAVRARDRRADEFAVRCAPAGSRAQAPTGGHRRRCAGTKPSARCRLPDRFLHTTPDAPAASPQPAVATDRGCQRRAAAAGKGDGQRTLQLASADMTGAITPWPGAIADRVPAATRTGLCAADRTGNASRHGRGATGARACRRRRNCRGRQVGTTIAVKRAADQRHLGHRRQHAPTADQTAARRCGSTIRGSTPCWCRPTCATS